MSATRHEPLPSSGSSQWPPHLAAWAKERLFKHHGISKKWFPFYLKELEFRYNQRDEHLFELLVERMSRYIPAWPEDEEPLLTSGSQRE